MIVGWNAFHPDKLRVCQGGAIFFKTNNLGVIYGKFYIQSVYFHITVSICTFFCKREKPLVKSTISQKKCAGYEVLSRTITIMYMN